MHDGPVVLVKFPNKDRFVPAHYEERNPFAKGPALNRPRLVPDPLPGFRFVETLNGWYAFTDPLAEP